MHRATKTAKDVNRKLVHPNANLFAEKHIAQNHVLIVQLQL